jgi:hypothetical protein
MTVNDFAGLDLSRYELRLRARRAANLPAFLGSTLRGAFGHALKAAVCVMNHRQCERCMVADRCIYPYLFETPVPADVPQLRGQQQAPHPFILSPPMLQAPKTVRQAKPDLPPAQARINPSAQPPSAHHLADGRTVKLVHSPVAARSASAPDEVEAEGRRQMKAGDELRFELLLMGRAIEYLPYVVYALSEMARGGLGADRTPFELTEVALIDEHGAQQSVYCGKSQRITVPDAATRSLQELIRLRLDQLMSATEFSIDTGRNIDAVGLKFLTPARIRVAGDLQVGMSFELLARNLLRRVSMLAAVHGRAQLGLDYRGLIARAAEVETRASNLRWWDWERYSNRQRTKMTLGGFVGEVEYAGQALQEFLPLIVAGELLHVGAGTGFGLGRYEVLRSNSKRAEPPSDAVSG